MTSTELKVGKVLWLLKINISTSLVPGRHGAWTALTDIMRAGVLERSLHSILVRFKHL